MKFVAFVTDFYIYLLKVLTVKVFVLFVSFPASNVTLNCV